ncbi:mitochondrial FAD carrier protein flx1 [Tilletia horrida]|nr:mitochondrial FAD carrier protein flx1 [Tilletia horrida]
MAAAGQGEVEGGPAKRRRTWLQWGSRESSEPEATAAERAAFAERHAASAFHDDRPPHSIGESGAERKGAGTREWEGAAPSSSEEEEHKSHEQTPLKPTKSSANTPSFFPSQAYDHAAAGIAAGVIATMCMNPLDLIKTKFQVDTRQPKPLKLALQPRNLVMAPVSISVDMYSALANIVHRDGWKGLYRGITPNVVGNASSWGLYFLWYTWIKEYMAARNGTLPDGRTKPLSAAQLLLAASESGAVTALMTNPIWVVKTRMYTTTREGLPANTALANSAASTQHVTSPLSGTTAEGSPRLANSTSARAAAHQSPYNTLWGSLRHIYTTEGVRGLWKGAGLALVGVSNGAIQFATYEKLKRWRTRVALTKLQTKQQDAAGGDGGRLSAPAPKVVVAEDTAVQLPNLEYVIISGAAKMIAITITYPYQVIRSRIQNHSTAHLYPNIPTCIRLTYANEGLRAFYKGMATNAFRILPGTCVTFVVYENVSWTLRRAAERRATAAATLASGGAEAQSST